MSNHVSSCKPMADWQGEMDIKIIDLTRRLSDGTEGYPGDHIGLSVAQLAQVESDGYNFSSFSHLEAHCGTHIDSPLHFIADGIDIASLPLQVPLATVISATNRRIGPEAFANAAQLTGRAVLIKTGWDQHIGGDDYYRDAPYLTPAAARLLAESEIAVLGIDFPSPDPIDSHDYPVHHILLGAGIPIVEGLVGLDQLSQTGGELLFVAFPLKVAGVEGSPVRAAVIVLDNK